MRERTEYVWGAFLLRFSLGMLYFIAGVGKFVGGLAAARQYIVASGGWLPGWSVQIFAAVLPFAELGLGLLLMLGLLRFPALVLGSLLMLALVLGSLIGGKPPTAANNMMYVFMFSAALFTSHWDWLALDTLLFRRRREITR